MNATCRTRVGIRAEAWSDRSAALIPWTGAVASVFGRRSALLTATLLFAIGSAVSGAAQSFRMLIAGRAVQGGSLAFHWNRSDSHFCVAQVLEAELFRR